MAIEYREWREGDDLALLEIWGGPETVQAGQFRGTLAPSGNAPWRRCIVAEDVVDGVAIPVAAAVVHEASLHPERLWAYIEVARDHRRAGIGSTLLTMLRHEAAQAPSGVSKLRCKVEPGTPGAAFAEAAGMAPIQRSRLVVVDPAPLKLPVFGDGSESAATDQVEDLATGSVELSDVVGRYYTAVHDWDSPGELERRHGAAFVPGRPQRRPRRDRAAGAQGQCLRARHRGQPEGPAGGVRHQLCRGSPGRRHRRCRRRPAGQPSEVFLGHEPKLGAEEARAAVRDLLALIAYQHPVMLELDDAMTALRAVVEPLLESGKAHVQGSETLVVSDPA